MVTAGVEPDRPFGKEPVEKSCIFLWLCGGPSHLDTWDLKPNAPEGIRGPYRPIATRVPGMQVCELAPNARNRVRISPAARWVKVTAST